MPCLPFLILRVVHEPMILQVVMGIWVVSGGEAVTVRVYDPKAVQNLDITFLSGWWAELGIPPLKSMAISGLRGVAGTPNQRVLPMITFDVTCTLFA